MFKALVFLLTNAVFIRINIPDFYAMAANKQLKLTGRIWLETEDGPLPGKGCVELLDKRKC
ncbi:hypothetical protein [Mucilaginibacter arboris]|uniref:Uncharacterized protein n=1 Tax=Mucilaginibacter arboris TaxID=2682090 RepID=A0A7K1SY55_9SPHI|nr:hypothetical protein [Mucilaginibacter arboris]MVN22255.1 hypothetical protein [Mucilaginibacter arboris]